MFPYKTFFNQYLLLTLLGACAFSCASRKSVLYFQDSDKVHLRKLNYSSSRIQFNDIISIKVTALKSETVAPYNIDNSLSSSTSFIEILKLQGYLVSQEGTIVFPILGTINVVGKTILGLEVLIQKLLIDQGHVNDPTVSIRRLNTKFTILGDVQRAGTYSITENNITLLQALGYAGDLTINGSRQNVLIIRDVDGVQQTKRIDLTTTDWFTSDFYVLKQNDIIIVNPNLNKIKSSGIMGSAGAVMSAISLVLTSILIVISK